MNILINAGVDMIDEENKKDEISIRTFILLTAICILVIILLRFGRVI